MMYRDAKKYSAYNVQVFKDGRYTLAETLRMITRDIQEYTNCIPNIDKRIQTEYKLYKNALSKLVAAIDYMSKQ